MTSGLGTTGKATVPPDEAIEEISGLLEMDDLKGGDSQSAGGSEQAVTGDGHGAGDAHEVSMETPGPVNFDSYLVPPPVADESSTGQAPEAESASSTNMAYEDLLEKLVLPATPTAPPEPVQSEEPPPFASPRTSSSYSAASSPGSLFQSNATPGPQPEERTVVTANPLLAEEQEAAAREAESYILPPAAVPTPAFAAYPIVAQPANPPVPSASLAPRKVVQVSYPVLGGMLLGAAFVGGLFTWGMRPSRVAAPSPTLVATPVVPVQPLRPVSPPPQVEQLPTQAPPPPAPAAAKPAAAAEAQPAREVPAAEPAAESGEGEAKAAPKAKAHHAVAKAPRPPKAVAPVASKPVAAKPVAAKPAPAKPAPSKKGGKGWVDPFL